MDVPTFVHRVEELPGVDIVPYLTPATGRYWTTLEELLDLLRRFSPRDFSPRDWTLKNMSDRVCAQLLLDIINAEQASEKLGGQL